ncbi:unnamed protein product [Adineta ricciae]|uniref:Peptidase S1 domain-containing protein n=1 Tax=Adineta ricciae TaxID=249248 RepID=A0A815TMT3_ADIRI|nr:unnamed protein product [Adineta ricciae]
MSVLRFKLLIFLICIIYNPDLIKSTEFSCNESASCGCSQYNAIVNSRIVGGEPAVNHSWGWAASLRVFSGIHICGGTILSPIYILTAAHCVDDPEIMNCNLKVAVGTDTLTDDEGQRIPVERIYLHPQWTPKTNENDIAVLKLITPIEFFNTSVAKICFPSISVSLATKFPKTDSSLVAIGWGSTTTPDGDTSNVLRQVTVQAIDSRERKCNNSINNPTLQFCAAVSNGGKDTCLGDSGGPIMYFSEMHQRWMIAGITSYGRGCAVSIYGGVYTRISMYIDWIKSITETYQIITIDENSAAMSMRSNKVVVVSQLFLLLILIIQILKHEIV